MGKYKGAKPAQANKIDQYKVFRLETLQLEHDQIQPEGVLDQTHTAAELVAVIQGSWVTLEGKIDSMAIKINHLNLDLQKVVDHTTAVEDSVDALNWKIKSLGAVVRN
ncbi:hypothetical protein NDU88_002992 [Pleurodeles waltl]|uniref:t-SNARE coiled-coil homology domain-containing protein n=1 Tax=Pleurodeles waltl TaxID=8319 RepID=A0AAV7M279_PLEWA|nr:hypothetical protein NDU88_002992 [Pleurodeles waltl]